MLPEILFPIEVEQAFHKYLDNKDILNLKLVCKAFNINRSENHAISFEEHEKQKSNTEICIMM